jgi:hypothetical protein
MGPRENPVPEIRGKQEMHELARTVFAALQEADLGEIAAEVRARVLDRGPESVVDSSVIDGVAQWSFKPMVELLLRHVLDIATRDGLQSAQRRDEIAATLHLAGF